MADNGFRGLRITNTLTRRKEDFVPADPANVRMYVCGPTVYDYAHIGNARPAIVFDVLFRLLRHLYGPQHVTYVRNITDVDDKINARALRDFGAEIDAGRMTLNEAIRQVTGRTYEQYHKDVAALGCLPPTEEPRATEHIAGMVSMIQDLIGRGHAYVAEGPEGREVLFETGSMADYGQLSKRRLEDQQAGARIDVKDHKRAPADFVLWKESSATEPGWDGDFTFEGKPVRIHGRPGWHIECSVMSKAFLGETFDIHGGGLDLIFPHHENEIAQSRCAHGTNVMAKYWMHNGFLQVEGRKMSKSEGNFVTIHELLETEKFGGRKWPGEVLRLAMLMTHYKEPIDFSVRRLEEAENILNLWLGIATSEPVESAPDARFLASLCDDLNVSAAISELSSILKGGWAGDEEHAQYFASLKLLGFDIFEIKAARRKSIELADSEIAAIVETRLAFIREKNWAEADRIRDELLAEGIQLKDGKDPETGERVTTWEVKR
ncbi:cysteine--tRNA ligase [Zhengella sp. ZM62]|uniref:cysteine--tRNA ligase n=1 Tax=Zhengella sedimenti TaxID=3390035 RepID=UPI003974CB46